MKTSTIHKKFRIFICATLIIIVQSSLYICAQTFKFELVRPEIVSARMDGFGGTYSALEAGFDTLSTNPAALAFVKKEWSISRLATEVSGPLFDLPAVIQSSDMQGSILDLVSKNNGVYIGANITGPISFGKVDKNFGFGIFNRTVTTADIPSLSKATILAGEEILLVGGYGLNIFEKNKHSISIGLQMKGFYQTFMYDSGTTIGVLNSFMNMDIAAIPAVVSTGFGIDLGVMYRLGDHFSAAITCKDIYTPVFSTHYANINTFASGVPDSVTMYDRLSPDLSVGVAYLIPVPASWVTITGWNVMLDYRDALDIFNPVYRNPILNVALGTEVILLDVVSLRAGISEAYLSTGLGLDLTVCQIDFAMFGSEMGLDPGKRPLLNLALAVSFEY